MADELMLIKKSTLVDFANAFRIITDSSDLLSTSNMSKIFKNSKIEQPVSVLEEQDLTFVFNEYIGANYWECQDMSISFVLKEGKEYTVTFDGVEYPCTAMVANFNGVDGIGVGNFGAVGLGENNGAPFLLGTTPQGAVVCFCFTTAGVHRVGISYKKVSMLGEGVNVEYNIKTGSFYGTGSVQTIEHNCGSVPDIIIVSSSYAPESGELCFAFGVSSQIMNRFPSGNYISFNKVFVPTGGNMGASSNEGFDLEEPFNYQYGLIHAVTDTTFKIGSDSAMGKTLEGRPYSYVCLYGITKYGVGYDETIGDYEKTLISIDRLIGGVS